MQLKEMRAAKEAGDYQQSLKATSQRILVACVGVMFCIGTQEADAQRHRVSASMGGYHTIAVRSDGTVWAWGNNGDGQLGDGTTLSRATPVQVVGLSGVIGVSAGANHSIALKADGTVWAWGNNIYGQLGDGTTVSKTTPVKVSNLTGVLGVSAGAHHNLVVTSAGYVSSWGYNAYGQLGNNSTVNSSVPVTVGTGPGIIAVAAGGFTSYALYTDGTVPMWGFNAYGQTADGTTINRLAPIDESGLLNVIAIAGGYYHAMALHSDGTVSTWGLNSYGQLGNNSTTTAYLPVSVGGGLSGVVGISGGGNHSLAVKSDGTVKSWGGNSAGQLGDNSVSTRLLPVSMSGVSGATFVSAGLDHSVVAKDCDVLACGGNTYGQLGDSTTTGRLLPVAAHIKICETLWGSMTFFKQSDPLNPVITLNPNAAGGPVVNISGGITAQTLQLSGAATFSGPVTLSSPLSTGSGGSGMNNSSLAADRFLYTTAIGTFGSATVTPFARTLLDDNSAADFRTTLGAAAQTDILPVPFWRYTITEQSQDYGALGAGHSAGSGVSYWPNRNTYLLLDNGPTQRIREFNRNGTLNRTITLTSFGDPEDIHWIANDEFVIAVERNSGSIDELVVVNLPTGVNTLDASAGRRIQINTGTSFTSVNNAGIEGVARIGNTFYFATEKYPSTPVVEWNVWRVPYDASGSTTPTRVFRLSGMVTNKATDISGMATDGTYLWLLSHEGATGDTSTTVVGRSRLLKVTVDGRLIEDTVLPCFNDGGMWNQAEGIEYFLDPTDNNRPKILLTGEIGNGTGNAGVDFMLLQAP